MLYISITKQLHLSHRFRPLLICLSLSLDVAVFIVLSVLFSCTMYIPMCIYCTVLAFSFTFIAHDVCPRFFAASYVAIVFAVLHMQQRNLKEKFVALLRRFKVSDEVSMV